MKTLILMMLLPAALSIALAADPVLPEDMAKFVTVQKGTIPIILSAPHGGKRPIADVPLRKGKDIPLFATVLDTNTSELAEKTSAQIAKRLGGKPWLVIPHFGRGYIDANRPAAAAYESPNAKPYYDAYHEALSTACRDVKTKYGRGLLLDIHGQAAFPKAICRGTRNGKSVTLLLERSGRDALIGKQSILGKLEREGYEVLPKCSAPADTKEEARFDGGHITGTYGSHTAYAIDAIQLEFGGNYRSREALDKTASDLADAVAAFYEAYLKEMKE